MVETLLENKATITNIYSDVVGGSKTWFNFKQVDECDLTDNS